MSDNALRQFILDELEFEPSIDAADIGVAVDGGIVTLTGHVPSYPQKLAVEQAVLRIKGVKGIAEEIQVRYHSGDGLHDDEIARRIVDMFKWSTLVPDGHVQVKVQHGWATLSGSLDWAYEKRGALDIVHGTRGVTGITDLIELKPRVTAKDVKAQIDAALHRAADLEGRSIKVTVAGDKVKLEGTVKTWHDRAMAERAAWSAPGVIEVQDLLLVG